VVNSVGIVHYDGREWQADHDTIADKAITGISAQAIWACGDFGSVDFYNGDSWASSQPAPTDDTLTAALAVPAGQGVVIWVFGNSGAILVRHMDQAN
jgi:hypothetical protein